MMTRLLLCLALLLTAAPALARTVTPTPIVLGEAFDLPSRAEGETRHITVWLPPSYAAGKAAYPVLYLLDGGEAQDLLPVVGLAALGGLNGVTDEMIVVGIESGPGLRMRDFTTPSEVERKQFPVQGEAARFRRFLADELLPLIAGRYRTSGETALMGESLAGYFVLDSALRQPDLVTTYIAVSPSIWWDDQSLVRDAATLLKARPWPAGRKLYLSQANEGALVAGAMDRLLATLRADGPPQLAWTFRAFPHERHLTTYHPSGLEALRWAFPGPEAEPAAEP
jgi:predicted alpha/beta superfamily hydrolase